MQRRTRNRICIWVIIGGLLNFLAYTIAYGALGGDAMNGALNYSDRGARWVYTVSGHYLNSTSGLQREVPRWVWYYSYVHSISLWPTQAMMMISMLFLARPHIIATMRESTWIRGPTFITAAMTLTIVVYSAMTIWFITHLIRDVAGNA